MANDNDVTIAETIVAAVADGATSLLQRIDVLAAKLGIAASTVWAFTVRAKRIDAQRDIATHAALLILVVLLLLWPLHVVRMQLPHTIVTQAHSHSEIKEGPCELYQDTYTGMVDTKPNGKRPTCIDRTHESVEVADPPSYIDEGPSSDACVYIILAALLTLVAFMFLLVAGSGIISGYAAMHTADYDAFKELLAEVKD